MPWAQLQVFRPGSVLILEGGQLGSLFVLKSGTVEVSRDGVKVATIDQRGAIFGEISVLLDIPHSASVQAVTVVEVYVIADALTTLESRPAWTLHLARLLARRVLSTTAALVASQQSIQQTEVVVLPEQAVALLGDPTL
jgi:CRP-like cAMP-binding protein